ncbi:hypothetical protein AVL50_07995 [Flammeovirga sp. SJP92]|nr:hypothetical protein AVL50_07995 [Flammeovirga sp. SJP92]
MYIVHSVIIKNRQLKELKVQYRKKCYLVVYIIRGNSVSFLNNSNSDFSETEGFHQIDDDYM